MELGPYILQVGQSPNRREFLTGPTGKATPICSISVTSVAVAHLRLPAGLWGGLQSHSWAFCNLLSLLAPSAAPHSATQRWGELGFLQNAVGRVGRVGRALAGLALPLLVQGKRMKSSWNGSPPPQLFFPLPSTAWHWYPRSPSSLLTLPPQQLPQGQELRD